MGSGTSDIINTIPPLLCPHETDFCDEILAFVCICSTSDKHDAYGEDLLCIRVGWHVAEPHAGQAAQGEVERCDVDTTDGGSGTGPIHTTYDVVGWLQALPEFMEPSCLDTEVKCDCVRWGIWLTMKPNGVGVKKRKYTWNTIYWICYRCCLSPFHNKNNETNSSNRSDAWEPELIHGLLSVRGMQSIPGEPRRHWWMVIGWRTLRAAWLQRSVQHHKRIIRAQRINPALSLDLLFYDT